MNWKVMSSTPAGGEDFSHSGGASFCPREERLDHC
jgi:hypothetical protein